MSTTGHCFHFGSVYSFILELFLHSSPGAYWALTDLGSSSFSILSFCLFILLLRFSRQEYWNGLPFLSPVDHILSELSTVTHLSWVALHGMAHSFTISKGCDPCDEFSFLWLWFSSVCLLLVSLRGLWELPDQKDWLWGNLGLVLMGRVMLSKSLIQ